MGKRAKAFFLLAFPILPASPSRLNAQEAPPERRPLRERLSLRNSAQAGYEFDTNVYKTFSGGTADSLARILIKSSGDLPVRGGALWGWRYQGGGKLYFEQSPQNTLIQYLALPFSWQFDRRAALIFTPELKYQNENDAFESLSPDPLDVNEDFFSTSPRLVLRLALPAGFFVEPHGEFTYYKFFAVDTFSFLRETAGISVRKLFGSRFASGLEFAYTAQQFEASPRADTQRSVAAYLQYLHTPFLSLRYQYDDNASSEGVYAYTNHRMAFLLSLPIGRGGDSDLDDDGGALLALHLLGTLQFQSFPAVYAFTQEGQRFLQTGAEDDFLNSLVFKASFHPWKNFVVEGKYTLYSNELSGDSADRAEKFRRSLYYGGLRVAF